MRKTVTVCIIMIIASGMLLLASHGSVATTVDMPPVSFVADEMSIRSKDKKVLFNIEIAENHDQLERGLMYREALPEDYAMLFLFPNEAIRSMWMKNTVIPLDMLFVDKDGRIVYIKHSATPYSTDLITPPYPALAVIEMAGGMAKHKEIKVGDIVIHPYFSNYHY